MGGLKVVTEKARELHSCFINLTSFNPIEDIKMFDINGLKEIPTKEECTGPIFRAKTPERKRYQTMIMTIGYWELKNGKTACVCFQLPITEGWYGVVKGEPQTMPRWWNKEGKDSRDSNYDLVEFIGNIEEK